MSQTTSFAAVIVIGSKAGDRGGLFAADAADLGHTHQNGDRGSQTDAVHAGDQVEPSREITMLANGGDQLLELGLQEPLEPVDLLLPTPTCFDPNALDLALPQPGRQAPIARGAIVDLQLIRAFVDRHVQLVLAGIDPGAHGVMLAHLLRPFLVMRTLGSFNHPGPMKSRSRSCSAAALVARERAIRRPATCSGCAPGAGHSSRNARTIPIREIG